MKEEQSFLEASRQICSTVILFINLILYSYKHKSDFGIKETEKQGLLSLTPNLCSALIKHHGWSFHPWCLFHCFGSIHFWRLKMDYQVYIISLHLASESVFKTAAAIGSLLDSLNIAPQTYWIRTCLLTSPCVIPKHISERMPSKLQGLCLRGIWPQMQDLIPLFIPFLFPLLLICTFLMKNYYILCFG